MVGYPKRDGKLQRINAVAVNDAVHVDVSDVAFFGELRFHLEQGLIEELVGRTPEHGCAHFPSGRAQISGKQFFVLEVDVDRIDELLAIEERPDCDLHARDPALQLENFDLIGKGPLVSIQHADYILSIFLFADKQSPLHVLGFAAGLDNVAIGIFYHVLHGFVEGIEFLVGDDVDAGFLQLFLSEGAVVLQRVAVGGAADDFLSLGAQGLGFLSLSERVIEDDDVGPVGVLLGVFGFGHEAVGNVGFFLVFDVVADFVAFLGDLPGDVADQSAERVEEKLFLFHGGLDAGSPGRKRRRQNYAESVTQGIRAMG